MFDVVALYHFAPVPEPKALHNQMRTLAEHANLRGTLLVAPEGLNGTLAGPRQGLDHLLQTIRALPGFAGLECKWSEAHTMPFGKLKVRLKQEIVTMGQTGLDPRRDVGTYVAPEEWNDLISSEDVAVIDTRNEYEVAIGSFRGSVDPGIDSFRDFPRWWQENKTRFAGKRVAMFCTGGIRCEKSTAYLKSQGVAEVFHLKGGILRYLEHVPEEKSLWGGACFVFDERVAVGHGLTETDHHLCRACRRPLEADDVARAEYEQGVQCHHCQDEYTATDRSRFRERQRQIELARKRGERHLK